MLFQHEFWTYIFSRSWNLINDISHIHNQYTLLYSDNQIVVAAQHKRTHMNSSAHTTPRDQHFMQIII